VRQVGRVDLGLSLRNAWRAKIFLRLVARRAWGSMSSGGALLDHTVSPDPDRHQRHDWDGLLEALDLEPPTDAALRLPRRLSLEARARLADVPPGPTVGLAPAAVGGASKRWPAERYGQLADRLADRGWRPVMVVGPGEDAVALAAAAGSTRDYPILGADTDVAGLAGLVTELDLIVGNDSGPVQLAATFGTPVVAIFGPTDPRRTRPLGATVQVVRREIECAPCARPTCPLVHHACMDGLSVDRVLAAVADP
jgi:heptosyltransferase-2